MTRSILAPHIRRNPIAGLHKWLIAHRAQEALPVVHTRRIACVPRHRHILPVPPDTEQRALAPIAGRGPSEGLVIVSTPAFVGCGREERGVFERGGDVERMDDIERAEDNERVEYTVGGVTSRDGSSQA